MAKQINPSLARLWRAHDARHYGSESGTTVKVSSEAQHRALDLLESGLTDTQFQNLDYLAKIERRELDELVARLGNLVTQTSSFLPAMSATEVENRFAEIIRLFALGDQDPAVTMQNRKLKKIFLSTLSRPGFMAIKALFAMGFAQVITTDGSRVKDKDVSEIGYSTTEVGMTRHQAALNAIGRPKSALQLHSRTTPVFEIVDCALVITNDVISPDSYQLWMTRDTPHVAITFTESGFRVSQLVVPGKVACLACNEIERMANDSDWLVTATQLAALDRDFANTSVLLLSIGLALGRISKYLDSQSLDYYHNREIVFDALTGKLSTISNPEANCGCRLLAEQTQTSPYRPTRTV